MKKAIVIAALATLVVTGCARQVHHINGAPTAKEYKTDQSFFLSGIGQTKKVNAAQVCGGASKVAAVETIRSPLNIIIGLVTFGIYTPHEQTVYCS